METQTQEQELVTEVTTIADEEAKTGETILPKSTSPEQLVQKASGMFIKARRDFAQVFEKLSSRGKMRVMNAVLDLPVDNVKVLLKEEDERLAFAIGQQAQQARFLIIQHHINERMRELKEQKAKEETKASEVTNQTTETQGEVK